LFSKVYQINVCRQQWQLELEIQYNHQLPGVKAFPTPQEASPEQEYLEHWYSEIQCI
jgi:hypothetical protein